MKTKYALNQASLVKRLEVTTVHFVGETIVELFQERINVISLERLMRKTFSGQLKTKAKTFQLFH